MTNPREVIDNYAEFTGEYLTVFDGLDEAIVGITTTHTRPTRVAYDVDKVIGILMERDGMNYEEAWEFFDFNIAGLWAGEYTPAIFWSVDHLKEHH